MLYVSTLQNRVEVLSSFKWCSQYSVRLVVSGVPGNPCQSCQATCETEGSWRACHGDEKKWDGVDY